jgi:soluble lytic murein transglycosylase-like protein
MRTLLVGVLKVALGVISTAAFLPAQSPGDAGAATKESLAKQHASASAVQDSLTRQRASLEKQTGRSGQNGFFVLPRPAGLGATPPLAGADCEPLPASEVDSLVERAANQEGLDQAVVRGVMRQESAFRPCVVSPKGAMGLMQLMPSTASQLGVLNPFDATANVDAGAKLLKELLVRYGGDLSLTLGAYNAGPSEVDAAAGIPDIPETQDYVKRILSSLNPKQ